MPENDTLVAQLLASNEAAIRYKTLTNTLNRPRDAVEVQVAQAEIPFSPLVQALLSERDSSGAIPHHPYAKWRGAHWVLACLADLGYPPGDRSLLPLMEQVYRWLFGEEHSRNIRLIAGRTRRCASQESNALYASLALGLADSRADELASRLVLWQWPDGGWNCDRRPEAIHSSYHESLIPLRALTLYSRLSGDPQAASAAERAAEVFLKRELFRRQRDGEVIAKEFITLHYPAYWHYDILYALKVLAEGGWIGDARCMAALDLLESKRLPGGGYPAEARYYRTSPKATTGRSLVGWGVTSQRQMNEFVTVDALFVLKSAGRLPAQESIIG